MMDRLRLPVLASIRGKTWLNSVYIGPASGDACEMRVMSEKGKDQAVNLLINLPARQAYLAIEGSGVVHRLDFYSPGSAPQRANAKGVVRPATGEPQPG